MADTSSSLTVKRIDEPTQSVLFFSGALDESAKLCWSRFPATAKRVVIKLREISRINSCGVREWIEFVSTVPEGTDLVFQQAPATFVKCVARISNFLGRGKLQSCIVELACPYCNFEMDHLVELHSISSDEARVDTLCPTCGRELQQEFSWDTLFNNDKSDGGTQNIECSEQHDSLISNVVVDVVRRIYTKSQVAAVLLRSDRHQFVWRNDAFSSLVCRTGEILTYDQICNLLTFTEVNGQLHLGPSEITQLRHSLVWQEVRLSHMPSRPLLLELIPLNYCNWILITLTDLSLEAMLHREHQALRNAADAVSRLRELQTDSVDLDESAHSYKTDLNILHSQIQALTLIADEIVKRLATTSS